MRKFELMPNDGRKSFYGKAIVEIDNEGSETLYSYGTPEQSTVHRIIRRI